MIEKNECKEKKIMGAWGEKAWENDEAADWFAEFITKVDTEFILEEAEQAMKYDDNYEIVRAIAYIIGHLGNNYIWPSNNLDRLNKVKDKLIHYYQNMLDEESDYMDLWDNDDNLKNELIKEVELLKN